MTANRASYDALQASPDDPTQQHRPESALADVLAELGALCSLALDLLYQSPVQTLLLDRELRVRWVNRTFCRARRLSEAEVLGRPAADLFGDLSAHSRRLARAFAGENLQMLLSTRPLPGGSVYDLNVHLRPVRTAAGEVVAVCAFVGDLSFRGATEEGVPNISQAMRQVLGSVPDLVMILDRELHVLFANRSVGPRTPEQMEGLHVADVLPPQLHEVALTSMRRALSSGQNDGFAAEIDVADGEKRHFEVRVGAILCNQQIAGLTLNAAETTGQVRAEHALATQARMIDSMLEGVAVIDADGVIEISNPAFDTMFGYQRGALIGGEMNALTAYGAGARGLWQPLTEAGESTAVEFEGRRRDGEYFAASGVLSGFELAGRNHSLLVLQDVSERKQLERAILQAVNREQYRIGNDLHDGLGQELTGIALMLRGLAGRLTAEYPPLLTDIESIMRLVSNAIESTRALARGLSPVNLERGGLRDALESLAMHASALYGVPTVFTHRMMGNRPVNAELANHLYRIAQEAVRNAVRHGQARSIRLHLSSSRAKVRLSITDDGVGMPIDATDAAGMGLKTMRYRARILGGDVRFEPVEPRGTRVLCECPFEAASVPARRQRKSGSRA